MSLWRLLVARWPGHGDRMNTEDSTEEEEDELAYEYIDAASIQYL
jgi:hypothetical protein